ncbi:MAG TPA: hypothetical protein VJ083_06755 [Sedimentibacter sp.]|nr:hypothetical protein [Sedimentibacter sp.]
METLLETELSNIHIGGSPLLNEYDFRASNFYDGYMSMSVMGEKIANDINFEKKLQKLYENKKKGNE